MSTSAAVLVEKYSNHGTEISRNTGNIGRIRHNTCYSTTFVEGITTLRPLFICLFVDCIFAGEHLIFGRFGFGTEGQPKIYTRDLEASEKAG